jgi:hypothetical protein
MVFGFRYKTPTAAPSTNNQSSDVIASTVPRRRMSEDKGGLSLLHHFRQQASLKNVVDDDDDGGGDGDVNLKSNHNCEVLDGTKYDKSSIHHQHSENQGCPTAPTAVEGQGNGKGPARVREASDRAKVPLPDLTSLLATKQRCRKHKRRREKCRQGQVEAKCLKLLVLGGRQSGKTSLIRRFCFHDKDEEANSAAGCEDHPDSPPTLGVGCYTRKIHITVPLPVPQENESERGKETADKGRHLHKNSLRQSHSQEFQSDVDGLEAPRDHNDHNCDHGKSQRINNATAKVTTKEVEVHVQLWDTPGDLPPPPPPPPPPQTPCRDDVDGSTTGGNTSSWNSSAPPAPAVMGPMAFLASSTIDGVILVYNATSLQSFQQAQQWYQILMADQQQRQRQHQHQKHKSRSRTRFPLEIMLVANHIDALYGQLSKPFERQVLPQRSVLLPSAPPLTSQQDPWPKRRGRRKPTRTIFRHSNNNAKQSSSLQQRQQVQQRQQNEPALWTLCPAPLQKYPGPAAKPITLEDVRQKAGPKGVEWMKERLGMSRQKQVLPQSSPPKTSVTIGNKITTVQEEKLAEDGAMRCNQGDITHNAEVHDSSHHGEEEEEDQEADELVSCTLGHEGSVDTHFDLGYGTITVRTLTMTASVSAASVSHMTTHGACDETTSLPSPTGSGSILGDGIEMGEDDGHCEEDKDGDGNEALFEMSLASTKSKDVSTNLESVSSKRPQLQPRPRPQPLPANTKMLPHIKVKESKAIALNMKSTPRSRPPPPPQPEWLKDERLYHNYVLSSDIDYYGITRPANKSHRLRCTSRNHDSSGTMASSNNSSSSSLLSLRHMNALWEHLCLPPIAADVSSHNSSNLNYGGMSYEGIWELSSHRGDSIPNREDVLQWCRGRAVAAQCDDSWGKADESWSNDRDIAAGTSTRTSTDISFHEASAKYGTGVHDAFESICRRTFLAMQQHDGDGGEADSGVGDRTNKMNGSTIDTSNVPLIPLPARRGSVWRDSHNLNSAAGSQHLHPSATRTGSSSFPEMSICTTFTSQDMASPLLIQPRQKIVVGFGPLGTTSAESRPSNPRLSSSAPDARHSNIIMAMATNMAKLSPLMYTPRMSGSGSATRKISANDNINDNININSNIKSNSSTNTANNNNNNHPYNMQLLPRRPPPAPPSRASSSSTSHPLYNANLGNHGHHSTNHNPANVFVYQPMFGSTTTKKSSKALKLYRKNNHYAYHSSKRPFILSERYHDQSTHNSSSRGYGYGYGSSLIHNNKSCTMMSVAMQPNSTMSSRANGDNGDSDLDLEPTTTTCIDFEKGCHLNKCGLFLCSPPSSSHLFQCCIIL